jgi:hypothetical protein
MLTPTATQNDGDHHPPPRLDLHLSRRQLLWGAAGLAGVC